MTSVLEMPVVLDGFELERCFDDAHSDIIQIDDTVSWPPLPLPQKFPVHGSKAQDLVSKATNRRLASVIAKSRRAMGTVILLEEAARWSCSDEDVRNSACTVASLIIAHDP